MRYNTPWHSPRVPRAARSSPRTEGPMPQGPKALYGPPEGCCSTIGPCPDADPTDALGPAARRCGVGGGRQQHPGYILVRLEVEDAVVPRMARLAPTPVEGAADPARGVVAPVSTSRTRTPGHPKMAHGLDPCLPPSPVRQPVGGAAVGAGAMALRLVGAAAPSADPLRRRRRGVELPPGSYPARGGAVAVRDGARGSVETPALVVGAPTGAAGGLGSRAAARSRLRPPASSAHDAPPSPAFVRNAWPKRHNVVTIYIIWWVFEIIYNHTAQARAPQARIRHGQTSREALAGTLLLAAVIMWTWLGPRARLQPS